MESHGHWQTIAATSIFHARDRRARTIRVVAKIIVVKVVLAKLAESMVSHERDRAS